MRGTARPTVRHWAAGRHCAPDDQTAPAESERPATPESARTPLAGPAARLELDTQPSAPGRKAGKAKGHADETNRISTFSVYPYLTVRAYRVRGFFRDLTSTVQLRVVQPRSPVSAGFTRFLAGWALSRGEGGTSARRLFVLRGRQARSIARADLISKRKSARQASPDTTLTSSCMCHPCARAQAYAPKRGTTSQHFSSRS